MGNEVSTADAQCPLDENSVSGLVPFEEIPPKCLIIENLVFSCGGVNVYAYAGAIRFLEKSLLLERIQRFSGVGEGAIVASLLALGYNSQALQELFDTAFNSLTLDRQNDNENLVDKMFSSFGCDTGSNFLDWFAEVLEKKSYAADLTFSTLYKETKKELCIVLTNIDNARLEYFHPKTTPDVSIRQAVLASMAIPGMFAPLKFGIGNAHYHYLHGGLMNRYPINSFDGWWLSMEKQNSFVSKCERLSTLDVAHSSFRTRTARTLGFFLIDKYDEKKYEEFIDRLRHCGADMAIPASHSGETYKTNLNRRLCISRSYNQLRGVCLQLIDVAKSCSDESGRICIEDLADKIISDKYFSESERILISPECGQTNDTCLAFLKGLSADGNLTSTELMSFIKRRVLLLMEKYPCFSSAVTDLRSYFRSVFEVQQRSIQNITHADYNRTVGIFCGHVNSSDRPGAVDRAFLYRQGWNATAVHLQDPGVPKI